MNRRLANIKLNRYEYEDHQDYPPPPPQTRKTCPICYFLQQIMATILIISTILSIALLTLK